MTQPNDDLMSLALQALDHATTSVVPEGGPLIPFTLTQVGGKSALNRFMAGTLEDSQERARQSLRHRPELERAAVAWDGYLTVADARTDAVFVEASEPGEASVVLAQRYARTGVLRRRWAPVGNPALVERREPLF